VNRALAIGLCLTCLPSLAAAQTPAVDIRGEIGATGLFMPGRDASELRGEAGLELTADMTPWLRLKLDGVVEGLVADRNMRVEDAVVRAREVWAEVRADNFDVRAGYGRLVWGRLDEIQPSDVLNPIDTSRYFLDGRNEARLPVAFVRGRVYLPGQVSVEALVSAPGRRGRYDQLDEASSPFNLVNDLILPAIVDRRVRRIEPATTFGNLQGGARISATFGRVDTSVSAYRGFESFGVLSIEPGAELAALVERFPRFTMMAADAETVVGSWAIRAEAAVFPDRYVMTPTGSVRGRMFEAGVGADRAAGDYHFFASVVWHRDWTREGPRMTNNDVSLIGSVERRFLRDVVQVRTFGVINPVDGAAFGRVLLSWSVRDNVMVEGSAGVFAGDDAGIDTLSRFRDRDFLFARVRWLF
jgi:hypothetical protein